MRAGLAIILAGSAALALSACGKKGADGAPAAGDKAQGPAAGGGAIAAGVPKPRPGMWKMTTEMAGMPQPLVVEQCLTPEMMDEAWGQQQQKDAGIVCSENSVRRVGASVVSRAVCKMNETTITTVATSSGDFNSRYTTTVVSTMDPPMAGMAETRNTITAERIGDCTE